MDDPPGSILAGRIINTVTIITKLNSVCSRKIQLGCIQGFAIKEPHFLLCAGTSLPLFNPHPTPVQQSSKVYTLYARMFFEIQGREITMQRTVRQSRRNKFQTTHTSLYMAPEPEHVICRKPAVSLFADLWKTGGRYTGDADHELNARHLQQGNNAMVRTNYIKRSRTSLITDIA